MLAAAVLLFALQSVSVRVGGDNNPKGKIGDSTARLDSIAERLERRAAMRARRDTTRRKPVHLTVTPELERTAFLDPGARSLLLRARDARMKQDTSLLSYDASAYQRLSVGMGFRAFGKERLLFRTENASRVQWSRRAGTHVDLKGKRAIFPMMDADDGDINGDDFSPVPYYPGREALWIGSGIAKSEVDEREMIHPIALGAEAYYRYALGDSVRYTLPDGKVIRLVELRIAPRRPEWRLSVGSFWFDDATAQLVRAAYRLAVPMNIWQVADEEIKRDAAETRARGETPDPDDEVPRWVKGFMSPMEANLEGVTIEYGLYGGRFWLPRTQYAEGWARASFMRIPFKIEESFKYAEVNGVDTLPTIPTSRVSLMDSLFGKDYGSWKSLSKEEKRERARTYDNADSLRRSQQNLGRAASCKSGDHWTRREERGDGAITVLVRVPCDTTLLVNSPELPKSIYDAGEQLFGSADRDELMKSLNFSLQPGWAPQPVVLTYGLPMTRYNRVEGLSSGVNGTMQLGQGYALDGTARLGTGDWVPNAEFGMSRSNGRHTWRAGAYQRLAVANDWGAPLSFGSGFGAFAYGRDDGFYFRSLGMELERFATRENGTRLRLFAERQRTATPTTTFNLSKALGGASAFGPNVRAEKGSALGSGVRDVRNFGLDPAGWRLFSDVRLEGGWFIPSDSSGRAFGRSGADLTVSHGLLSSAAVGVTIGGGISSGAPEQRQFFLGGTQSVRGQLAGAGFGEAYWLTRLELAATRGTVRPVVFGDLGWAGQRSDFSHPGRPLSGAGVGLSILDGLFRFDVARGIYPRNKLRFDAYLEARF
ncbi:MAG: hypothetical protein ABI877_13010 [Gemmatimonadaceae bacterium]